jgi:hypothetical protein
MDDKILVSKQTIYNLQDFFDSMTSDILTVRGIIYYTGLPENRAEEVLAAIRDLLNTQF